MTFFSRISLLLTGLILLCSSANAEQLDCVTPGSVPVDTVTMTTAVVDLDPGVLFKKAPTHQIIYEVIVMRNPNGQTDLRVDIGSIRFTGNGDEVNLLGTDQILGTVGGSATVQLALGMGIIDCTGQLSSQRVRVVQAECGERVGSGLLTHFVPCTGAGCSVRQYTVQCLLGDFGIIPL